MNRILIGATAAIGFSVACSPARPATGTGEPVAISVAQMPAPGSFPTTAPLPGPAPALSLPASTRRTLPNGLEVVYVRHGSLPVVHATLVTPAGNMRDPESLPGLAGFTSQMLDEGAGGKTSLQLSEALDQLGASLSTGVSWDAATINLHVLRDRLPQALELMADVVVRPDVPENELSRVRDEQITELVSARDEPAIIAANAANALVFGGEHPYGRLPTVESTRRFMRDSITAFHSQYYRPVGSTLILVGDVNPDTIHPTVERAFGAWAGRAPANVVPGQSPYPARTTVYLIDKPGAAQSEIRIGHVGVPRASPDYFPLIVLNTILGGSFTSRLNTNLREIHGYSYGASSSLGMRLGAGPFVAGSSVFTAKTDSAVIEFLRELRRIREDSVSADELLRAKNYVALGLPRQFETTAGVANQLAQVEVYDLPGDFYNSYVPRIMAVTAADVQRVARQYIQPDRAVIVVVGDRAQIEPGLRALNLAAFEVRPAEEFVP